MGRGIFYKSLKTPKINASADFINKYTSEFDLRQHRITHKKNKSSINSLETIMELPQITFARKTKLSCQKFSVNQNQICQYKGTS